MTIAALIVDAIAVTVSVTSLLKTRRAYLQTKANLDEIRRLQAEGVDR